MSIKRLWMLLAAVAMIVGVMAPASAQGPDSGHLEDQGWTCMPAGPVDRIHCFNPNGGQGHAASVMVFDPDGEEFLGIETLRFTDRDLSNKACPPGNHPWVEIAPGVWACHHWKAGTEPEGG